MSTQEEANNSVTHHEHLERLLQTERSAREAAQRANQAKSQFLANMSHEIRSPLGAILGFADLALNESDLSPDVREYLEFIQRNGDHLLHLIGDILDLAKIEAGRIEVECVKFSVPSLIRELIASMHPHAKTKKVELTCDVDPKAPDLLVGDPTKLRQILQNLISNAIKFTTNGKVHLTVHRKVDQLFFEIQDDGVGIAPDHCERIFEPFRQAESSTCRLYGGTGLGLTLSKSLAQALGGELQLVRSELGFGSLFRLALPIETHSPLLSTAEALACEPATWFNLKGQKVLVVDDSKDTQRLISRYLQQAGAMVDVADNGAIGIERASSKSYDCVLMDIQMPQMDGYEATKRLRASGFCRPIIALSARAMRDECELALDHGFNLYLTKPLSRGSLLNALSSQLTQGSN